jgi:hypothetical protein
MTLTVILHTVKLHANALFSQIVIHSDLEFFPTRILIRHHGVLKNLPDTNNY